ncbi:MAG: ATP-binding protein [Pseudomonadota bacterium]
MNELELPTLPRILIVEDNPVIARGLRHQLESLGYEVCATASTGEEAISRAKEHSPDLVLMDIRLDGHMEGTEAAVTIRTLLKVPIVFATAHADEAVLERAKKSEPFGFLIKPHTERELRSTVEMALVKARAEKALIQAEEEWERTFDAVPDLIMILNNEHRIIRANKAACTRLGLTKEEMIGGECYRLFHGTGSPPNWCPHARLMYDGKEHAHEISEEYLGGTFDVSVSPIFDTNNRLTGSVHVARDVTRRKRDQEKLAQLIEEVKHFAYIVSHDLRAPLSSLKGFRKELETGIEIIRPAVEKALPFLEPQEQAKVRSTLQEDIAEALQFMDSSAEQMGRLIDAVLDLSQSGRRSLSFQRLDMNELVRETLNALDHQLSDRKVNVQLGSLPDTVADQTAMEQIFLNLLDNAVKFMLPERPGTVEISGRHFPDENVFVVRDTGRGIDRAHLTRIFHVFQRVGKQDVPGEGMGLAHVRTLVRRHGGNIWCDSEPGHGSTFTFTVSNRLAIQGETP